MPATNSWRPFSAPLFAALLQRKVVFSLQVKSRPGVSVVCFVAVEPSVVLLACPFQHCGTAPLQRRMSDRGDPEAELSCASSGSVSEQEPADASHSAAKPARAAAVGPPLLVALHSTQRQIAGVRLDIAADPGESRAQRLRASGTHIGVLPKIYRFDETTIGGDASALTADGGIVHTTLSSPVYLLRDSALVIHGHVSAPGDPKTPFLAPICSAALVEVSRCAGALMAAERGRAFDRIEIEATAFLGSKSASSRRCILPPTEILSEEESLSVSKRLLKTYLRKENQPSLLAISWRGRRRLRPSIVNSALIVFVYQCSPSASAVQFLPTGTAARAETHSTVAGMSASQTFVPHNRAVHALMDSLVHRNVGSFRGHPVARILQPLLQTPGSLIALLGLLDEHVTSPDHVKNLLVLLKQLHDPSSAHPPFSCSPPPPPPPPLATSHAVSLPRTEDILDENAGVLLSAHRSFAALSSYVAIVKSPPAASHQKSSAEPSCSLPPHSTEPISASAAHKKKPLLPAGPEGRTFRDLVNFFLENDAGRP